MFLLINDFSSDVITASPPRQPEVLSTIYPPIDRSPDLLQVQTPCAIETVPTNDIASIAPSHDIGRIVNVTNSEQKHTTLATFDDVLLDTTPCMVLRPPKAACAGI